MDSKGQVMTCQACRSQHAEDERDVPCDTGGLDACPYWRTHGMSPGALDPLPIVAIALQCWARIQRLGWAIAERLCAANARTSAEFFLLYELLYELQRDQEQQRQAWEQQQREYAARQQRS